MEKEAKKNGEENINTSLERIDAIKTLIFGENMEEYEKKFHELFAKIEEFHAEFEDRMLKTKKKMIQDVNLLTKKIDNRAAEMEMDFAKKMAKLDDDKSDRRSLSKMLKEIAAKLEE